MSEENRGCWEWNEQRWGWREEKWAGRDHPEQLSQDLVGV